MNFDNHDLLKAIAITAELTGTELSEHGLEALELKLKRYPLPNVVAALNHCQEFGLRLTLHAVKTCLDEADGRPRADEAWAIASESSDENLTVVLTNEMSEALFVIRPLLMAGDKVAARRAFIDVYERLVRDARQKGEGVLWAAQLGRDRYHREAVILAAIERGKLKRENVSHLLPLSNADVSGLLEHTATAIEYDEATRRRALNMLEQLRSLCKKPAVYAADQLAKRKWQRQQEEDRRQILLAQSHEGQSNRTEFTKGGLFHADVKGQ